MSAAETTANDFPRLNINTPDLIAEIECLLAEAANSKDEFGAVNWGDLGVADIEYRLSMLTPDARPYCVVLVEEASPDCGLSMWVGERINKTKFPHVVIQCEW